MSIWATFFHLNDDTAPIVYYASHLFPTDIRDGNVDLALIPGFISPDGPAEDGDEDAAPHPFVRLSVNQESVVLDADQALRMFYALGDWLSRRSAALPVVERKAPE